MKYKNIMEDKANNHKHEHLFARFLSALKPKDKNELADVIHEASEREIIDETTEDMIHGVFDITRLRVSDVMIPRSDIVTINIQSSLIDAVKIIDKYGHSRYPVISEDKDHIAGILMAKDLLPYACGLKKLDGGIKALLRKAMIVPESKHVDALLEEFQARRFHIAIVVDEFGGVCGLVTIEDIIELIVGDIEDEYEVNTHDPSLISPTDSANTYKVQGITPILDFEEFFEVKLPEADVGTIAGLILHILGRFPRRGESLTLGKLSFKITEANIRQIHEIEVTVDPNYQEDAEDIEE